MKAIELFFERILWFSRLVVIVPVLFSLLLAIGMFYTTTLDAITLSGEQFSYGALDDAGRSVARIDALVEIVSIIDKYLLAGLMLIFALGLYELYIGPINAIEKSEFAKRLLLIKSFDDLKDRLANVILLILAVKFFQQALSLKYETVNDLLILAIGTSLIGVSFFLTRKFFFQTREGAASTEDKK